MGFDVGGVKLTSPTSTTFSVDAATNWMAVNANGIVTRPQTPFFCGQLNGRGSPYFANPLLVTADVNVGNCWNNSNGYFTCPVAGYYLVTGGGIASTQAGYFDIQRNGLRQHFTHWNHTASWHYVSLSCIFYCALYDNIKYALLNTTPTSGVGFYGAGGHGMYSIALLT
jgi:hypothetical protein